MHSYGAKQAAKGKPTACLNPCFNGRCTRTERKDFLLKKAFIVLILVLMEDALVLS